MFTRTLAELLCTIVKFLQSKQDFSTAAVGKPLSCYNPTASVWMHESSNWSKIKVQSAYFWPFIRYRRKRPKVDANIFDSALSHTRHSDASEEKEKNSVSTFGRFRLWTSFESSPVSVNGSVYACFNSCLLRVYGGCRSDRRRFWAIQQTVSCLRRNYRL